MGRVLSALPTAPITPRLSTPVGMCQSREPVEPHSPSREQHNSRMPQIPLAKPHGPPGFPHRLVALIAFERVLVICGAPTRRTHVRDFAAIAFMSHTTSWRETSHSQERSTRVLPTLYICVRVPAHWSDSRTTMNAVRSRQSYHMPLLLSVSTMWCAVTDKPQRPEA